MKKDETVGTSDAGEKLDIRVLSKPCEEALGGAKLGFVLAVNLDGTFQLHRPDGVDARQHRPPFPTKLVRELTGAAILACEASPACVWLDIGGMCVEFCE